MKSNEPFQKSRFTIRLKLMVIISGIILVSLGGIISVATFFFKNDSDVRIRENNAKLTEVISEKVKGDFNAVKQTITIAASSLVSHPESKTSIQKVLFDNDGGVLYIGVFDKNIQVAQKLINEGFLSSTGYTEENFNMILSSNKAQFARSFTGATEVLNASPNFQKPILALSFPLGDPSSPKNIIIAFIKMETILSAFQASGITETFMVSEEGNVIAHPNPTIVLAGVNFLDLPIVERMKKSTVDNGQNRYQHKDGNWYLGTFRKLGFAGAGVISTVSEDLVFAEVYNIQRRNIILMIVILNIAVIIVFFFSKSISEPILSLVGAAEEIGKGNYEVRLQNKSTDEIGVLTESFNHMGQGLLEREKLKVSFGKFVNEELAELSMKGELKTGGTRKHCAIFFSDIRGFTSISEQLEPEEVVEFLNQYMSEMVRCVNVTGGYVDKFIGDAIMATWGALRETGKETENAITASLMMREALLKFNIGRGSVKKPIIRIGCGINTGPVIAGQIGSDEKLEYTVIGDAVNLASRIESMNKGLGTDLLISEDSYLEVKDIFKVQKMDEMKVKGKSKPQIIYAVLGRLDDPRCPKNLNELRKLVGIKFDPKANASGEKYEVVKK